MQAAVDTKRMMPGQKAETISILHFNDVYNVESREVEPVGGAARWLFFVSSFEAALSLAMNKFTRFAGLSPL